MSRIGNGRRQDPAAVFLRDRPNRVNPGARHMKFRCCRAGSAGCTEKSRAPESVPHSMIAVVLVASVLRG